VTEFWNPTGPGIRSAAVLRGRSPCPDDPHLTAPEDHRAPEKLTSHGFGRSPTLAAPVRGRLPHSVVWSRLGVFAHGQRYEHHKEQQCDPAEGDWEGVVHRPCGVRGGCRAGVAE
jgi:hypothetical protein